MRRGPSRGQWGKQPVAPTGGNHSFPNSGRLLRQKAKSFVEGPSNDLHPRGRATPKMQKGVHECVRQSRSQDYFIGVVPGLHQKQAAQASATRPGVCPSNDGEDSTEKQRAYSEVPNIVSAGRSATEGAGPNRDTIAEPPGGWESVAPKPQQRPENRGRELQLSTLA